jgi:hypothetical protein
MKLGFHFTEGRKNAVPAWHAATTECAEAPYKAFSIYGRGSISVAQGALCCLFRLSSTKVSSQSDRIFAQSMEFLGARDLSELFHDHSRRLVAPYLDRWATAPNEVVSYIVHADTRRRSEVYDLTFNKTLTGVIPGAIVGAIRAAAHENPVQALLDTVYQTSLLEAGGNPFGLKVHQARTKRIKTIDEMVYREFGLDSAKKRDDLARHKDIRLEDVQTVAKPQPRECPYCALAAA